MEVRKGQVFIVGTLLFATLITGIVLLNQDSSVVFSGSDTPKAMMERGVDEYPRALNTALEVNSTAEEVRRRLASYMGFHAYAVRSHGVGSREHAVVSVPNSTGVTAVVGNFRNTVMENAWIKVGTTSKDLSNLDAGETRLVNFPPVSGDPKVMFNATADRLINNSFRATDHGVTALYNLRVEGEDQTWVDTSTY